MMTAPCRHFSDLTHEYPTNFCIIIPVHVRTMNDVRTVFVFMNNSLGLSCCLSAKLGLETNSEMLRVY